MSLSEFLSLLAMLVSLISVFLTVYLQYFRASKLKVYPGEIQQLCYTNNYVINLFLDLVFVNEGARPCIITKVQCNLNDDGRTYPLGWLGFYQSIDANDNLLDGLKNFNRFVSSAELIPLGGYQIEKKKISFVTAEPVRLETEGTKTIEILVYTSLDPRRPVKYRYSFLMTAEAIQNLFLKSVGDANNVVGEMGNFKIERA